MSATIGKKELSNYFTNEEAKTEEFKIPDEWTDSTRVINILNKYNILDVFQDKRIQVCWDNKRQRYVFMIWHGGKCFGGIGRSFVNKPKWLFYKAYEKQNKFPLIVPKHGTYYAPYYPSKSKKIGVVVEDAISAAAVSHYYDGIAILGTHIPSNYISVLYKYDAIYIALDKDATNKALEYQKYMNIFIPTKIIMLEQDLKDMTKDEIEKKLNLG